MTALKFSARRALFLQSLADEVEAVAGRRDQLQELIGRYVTEQGLKLSFQGGTHIARMRGVSASATEGYAAALTAWARAARRDLASEAAA